jgi:hypothetical protein
MKREDRRPYIGGLDDIECSNLFRHNALFYHVKEVIENNSDKNSYIDNEDLVAVEDAQISRVIGIIENKLKEDLFEFAEELDRCKQANDKYIDGLLDACNIPAYDPD